MRRLAPVVALFFLAPWTAECSWGGFTAQEFPFVVVILGPLYGGAAILIREYARRTGAGWPAIVLLAAAFGVIQAGLVDQSLFNTHFLDDTQFSGNAPDAVSYIGNHVALSICAPIAIVESFVGSPRRTAPWLRPVGLGVTVVLYALGSLLIYFDDSGRKGFVLSTGQFIEAVSAIAVLIGLALLPRWRRRRDRVDGSVPHPAWVALVAGAAYLAPNLTTGWYNVTATIVAVAVVVSMLALWSRRTGWSQRHVLAAACGPLIVAAAQAYVVPTYAPASPMSALVGDIGISVVVVLLVGGAFLRVDHDVRGRDTPSNATPSS